MNVFVVIHRKCSPPLSGYNYFSFVPDSLACLCTPSWSVKCLSEPTELPWWQEFEMAIVFTMSDLFLVYRSPKTIAKKNSLKISHLLERVGIVSILCMLNDQTRLKWIKHLCNDLNLMNMM